MIYLLMSLNSVKRHWRPKPKDRSGSARNEAAKPPLTMNRIAPGVKLFRPLFIRLRLEL